MDYSYVLRKLKAFFGINYYEMGRRANLQYETVEKYASNVRVKKMAPLTKEKLDAAIYDTLAELNLSLEEFMELEFI